MTFTPRIGIVCRLVPEASGKRLFQSTPAPYIEAILAAGGCPFLLPMCPTPALIHQQVAAVDGVLLIGGEDVDPARYGASPHPKLGEVSSPRDDYELELIRFAVQRAKPLLGICRGIQVLNVALGGSLYQDLPSEFAKAEDHAVPDWTTIVHTLELAPSSRLREILGQSRVGINSRHHQAIRKLAPGLVATAQAADGVIEAVELPSHPFCVAVQGHPEMLWNARQPAWANLFLGFVAACGARQGV